MAKKKRKKTEAEEQEPVTAPAVMGFSDPEPAPVSTRNLERPKGSIRIVPGRKDAK